MPEVFHLDVVALDCPGEAVELDIVFCRALAAPVVREDAVLNSLLKKGEDLPFQLRRKVLQQAELLSLFHDPTRVCVDRSIDLGQLLQENSDGSLVLFDKFRGRKKRLIAGFDAD